MESNNLASVNRRKFHIEEPVLWYRCPDYPWCIAQPLNGLLIGKSSYWEIFYIEVVLYLCSKVTWRSSNLLALHVVSLQICLRFRIRVLCNGIYVNKKQMKSLEISITVAVSLNVAVANVKYIFNIDILVN